MKTKSVPALAVIPATEDAIRAYAYHLYEQSDRAPGHEVEHWLEASAFLNGTQAPKRPV